MTLPMLDALFFADERFAAELQSELQIPAEKVEEIRTLAREERLGLREAGSDDDARSTQAASERAVEHISNLIGEEKTRQLSAFVLDHWRYHSGDTGDTGNRAETMPAASPSPGITPAASPSPEATAGTAPSPGAPPSPGVSPSPATSPSPAASATPEMSPPYSAPSDTRIVINAPAYRMDVFSGGQLMSSYTIAIGYPEFPLPTGLREAGSIIINPTWTPPDEPWVEAPGSRVKVGEQVPAGSRLNPLGVAKIPIGLPSLIHGGKREAQLGGFGSHGCVGLTDAQLKDFALLLATIGGTELTAGQIENFRKNRKVTKSIRLAQPIPVELRYQTIMVIDGKLHIYRDIYDQGTNTEENLRTVLAAYGVTLEELSAAEHARVMEGLAEMARDARGRAVEPRPGVSPAVTPTPEKETKRAAQRPKLTRTVKGSKEAVIEIAALAGKGYPAPVGVEEVSRRR